MKIHQNIVLLCVTIYIGIVDTNGAELESLPDFTLTHQDRDQLAQLGNNFRSEMNNSQTVEARKAAILEFWEDNTLSAPDAQTDAQRNTAIETTVSALLMAKRPIFYAVRDGASVEIKNIQERKTVFAKSVAYTALVTDPEKLGPQIPALLESRRTRASFSRDDHFAVLVIKDLAAQCPSVVTLNPEDLAKWKNLANSANAACRLAAITAIGHVTSSLPDRSAVFSEISDEVQKPILSVLIGESSALSPDDRVAFLTNLKANNSNLTSEQIEKINSILQ